MFYGFKMDEAEIHDPVDSPKNLFTKMKETQNWNIFISQYKLNSKYSFKILCKSLCYDLSGSIYTSGSIMGRQPCRCGDIAHKRGNEFHIPHFELQITEIQQGDKLYVPTTTNIPFWYHYKIYVYLQVREQKL